jgi:lon-related putative ATP-dependent protease
VTVLSPSEINALARKKLALLPEQLNVAVSSTVIAEAFSANIKSTSLIGQERAKDALSFGLGVDAQGYNLYVMGEESTGRYTLVSDFIKAQKSTKYPLLDWCYLNNLEQEREPIALSLPAGQSKELVDDIEVLIDEILVIFPAVFENPAFQRKQGAINRHFDEKYESAIVKVEKLALSLNVSLIEDGNRVTFAPIVDGKPLNDREFSSETEVDRQQYFDAIDVLEEHLSEALLELPSWQRESLGQKKTLKQETVEQNIRPLLKDLERKYAHNIAILKYLRLLKHHLIDMVIEVLSAEDTKEEKIDEYDKRSLFIDTYLPNVMVANKVDDEAPLIYEPNPTYQNLFGKIEYTSVQGSVYTNYRMITAGALHKANSGYLVLDADKLLDHPHVWESLKLALKFGLIRLELPQQDVGMVNNITQTPQPIPLQVKLILLGSRDLYYTLQEYDPEFSELVRVLVDFDHEIDLNQNNINHFVARIREHVSAIGLDDISGEAMAEFIRYSLRQAEHQSKLCAKFADVIELVNEANYFCKQDNKTILQTTHIEAALNAKKCRSGRVSDTFLLDIEEGHVLISTDGKAIGTLNGLTVLEVGGTAFGTPARVTATVYAGSSGVVDIEREVELGQSIHSKGVLLLTGYLGNKYAKSFPLTLSANIALEQSYGYIDGDSASLAELIALISSLTDIPLQQGIAVTGSINQLGEVQAVGGINEKIEGYFTLCTKRGLSGEQGVIIPKSNHVNLMLSDAVKQAVSDGLFSVYPVSDVDEALCIIMGHVAGEISSRGTYPKNTIHHVAISRLFAIANVVNGGAEE